MSVGTSDSIGIGVSVGTSDGIDIGVNVGTSDGIGIGVSVGTSDGIGIEHGYECRSVGDEIEERWSGYRVEMEWIQGGCCHKINFRLADNNLGIFYSSVDVFDCAYYAFTYTPAKKKQRCNISLV